MKTIKVKSFLNVPQNYTGIAIRSDGTKHWRLNGKFHREDGPAVVCANGEKYWWLNGKKVGKQTVELFYMLKYKKLIKL
jgi:hypothetical protein